MSCFCATLSCAGLLVVEDPSAPATCTRLDARSFVEHRKVLACLIHELLYVADFLLTANIVKPVST